MKLSRRFSVKILIISAVLLICGLVLFISSLNGKKARHLSSVPNPEAKETITSSIAETQREKGTESKEEIKLAEIFATATDPSFAKYRYEQMKIDPNFDWKQPINFWGKVVDENELPVQQAQIYFSWNDTSQKGTSQANTISDGGGLFSLLDRTGKRLSLSVSKEGYYDSKDARQSFEYADPFEGRFTPYANKPVVFHLRKKRNGVDLITSQYGMRDSFAVSTPVDGMPVRVNLLERKTGEGPLTITQIKPESKKWKQANEWSFRMEIPDGGFVEHNYEFPFEAPQDDYQSVVEFKFEKDQPNWTLNLKKNYYIRFGNPPRYARLQLETSIMMGGARLTYAINPTGSRNLEYGPRQSSSTENHFPPE